jgi:hypothetical protein
MSAPIAKRDFSKLKHFPGAHGNRFDTFLRAFDVLERLPAPVFALVLFGMALLPVRAQWPLALGLWAFMLLDWALIAALPRARKSFGPAKPPAFLLAGLRLIPAAFPLPLALAAQAVGTALVVYGFWIEPHRLSLTRQTLRSPKLALGRPLRLLHVGDLHMERITQRDQRLIALAREAAPDLILFSGDFLNLSYLRDPEAREAARAILRQLAEAARPPLGFFAVAGSPAVDLDDVVPLVLDGLPIHWLRDERITLTHAGQPIDLVGLGCTHKPFVDGPRLLSTLNGREASRFTILLYHSPDLAPEAAEAGIDLQLSGHTHGGQVRLPLIGALFTGSLYGKRFESGRRQVGEMTLYVTRGLGLEGKGAPRVRFLCPPEISLWEIG